jgi:hypothetical protein
MIALVRPLQLRVLCSRILLRLNHRPLLPYRLQPHGTIAPRAMAVTARDVSIQLTAQEEELFNILMKTLEYERLTTVLRCAGGWVRDKLLKKDSHDIDLAIDNKLGQEMAQHINNYLSSRDMQVQKVIVLNTPHALVHQPESSLAEGMARMLYSLLAASRGDLIIYVWRSGLAGGSHREQPRPVEAPGDRAHDSGRPGAGPSKPAQREICGPVVAHPHHGVWHAGGGRPAVGSIRA